MAYQLIADTEKEALIVKYTEQVNLEERLDALRKGSELLRTYGYRRIMVDLRHAIIMMDPGESLELGETMSITPELKFARTAFLVEMDNHSNSFVEIFAGNRGLEYNQFTDETMAWEWLMN